MTADRAALDAHLDLLDAFDLEEDDPGEVARVVLALHNAYCTIEAIVERVTLFVHGSIAAIFSPAAVAELSDLRAFRHLVNHAYAAEYDPERLRWLRARAPRLRPALHADLEALESWLGSLGPTTGGARG